MKEITLNLRLDEQSNRILDLVKASYGLSNKSEAANKIFHESGRKMLEPVLREEFAEQILRNTETWEHEHKFKRKTTLKELDAL